MTNSQELAVERMSNLSNNSIKILSFDIDNTLIDLQTLRTGFSDVWQEFRPESGELLLTYNTGRLYEDVIGLIERGIIPSPHFILGGVGTHIFDVREGHVLSEFSDRLIEGWDLITVDKTMRNLPFPIEIQPPDFQHDFKRSYFLDNASIEDVRTIESILPEAGLEVNVIYSGRRYLDILPGGANKGNALAWLLNWLGKHTQEALVAGDSGNDLAMFKLEEINGILVGNAEEELHSEISAPGIYHAKRHKYAGVVEGLVHFGVFPMEALTKIDKN